MNKTKTKYEPPVWSHGPYDNAGGRHKRVRAFRILQYWLKVVHGIKWDDLTIAQQLDYFDQCDKGDWDEKFAEEIEYWATWGKWPTNMFKPTNRI